MAKTIEKVALVPTGNKIVMLRDEAQSVTPGGIHLPEAAKDRPQRGKVLAVGPGRVLDNGDRAAMEVSDGDVVYFTAYAGNEIKLDGETYLVMRDDDVLAKVEEI